MLLVGRVLLGESLVITGALGLVAGAWGTVWFRDLTSQHPELVAAADQLPPVLADIVRRPPPISSWAPVTYVNAVQLAARDLVFATDEAFTESWHTATLRQFRGPLYRILMMVATPMMLLKGMGTESRWQTFHRGVKLQVQDLRPGRATFNLSYPTNLMPELIVRALGGSFHATIEAAGGREVRVDLVRFTSLSAVYEGRWR